MFLSCCTKKLIKTMEAIHTTRPSRWCIVLSVLLASRVLSFMAPALANANIFVTGLDSQPRAKLVYSSVENYSRIRHEQILLQLHFRASGIVQFIKVKFTKPLQFLIICIDFYRLDALCIYRVSIASTLHHLQVELLL